MSKNKPKIGVALGGGGLLGIAHIGVMKMLAVAGIKPDFITGTSMGGLIAGAYAAGLDLGELETEILKLSSTRQLLQFIDIGANFSGLVKGNRTFNYLHNLIGDLNFDQLQTPLTVVATDLKTGREAHLNSGSLLPALRATMSIPGVFEPVELGAYRLIDGGMLNNVPVDVARAMGADIVIAVDVMPTFVEADLRPQLTTPAFGAVTHDLLQTGLIMLSAITELKFKLDPPDLLLRPKIPTGVTFMAGYHQMSRIIDCGEQAIIANLPALRQIVRAG